MKPLKNETGASTATISRVRRCFDYGNEGYNDILGRLYPDEKPFTSKNVAHSLIINNEQPQKTS